MRRFKILFAVVTVALAGQVNAAVVYDEATSGDLSDDGANPTPISLSVGSNEIMGSSSHAPLDRDVWTVTLDPGHTLESVLLANYDTTEDQSFFAVEAGGQITAFDNATSLLGSSLIGGRAGSQQGEDVLDDLGGASLGGTGFTGGLEAGQYTFWFQETTALTAYSFSLNVSAVPEPSSTSSWLLIALVSWVARRRR